MERQSWDGRRDSDDGRLKKKTKSHRTRQGSTVAPIKKIKKKGIAIITIVMNGQEMRTKTLKNAKLITKIISDKITNKITTEEIYDNRTQKFWSKEQIKKRGCDWFLNLDDVKETLNWNLNGDSSKYQFKWGKSTKFFSEGYAYIFD